MIGCILAYSIFTGMCYSWHAFGGWGHALSGLGMGGEWSLAVALVIECWPERHRPKLAGIIGALERRPSVVGRSLWRSRGR